jgi:hypothetical protein
MLKVDEKLCKKYRPNIKVKNYFCTPLKMSRTILFEDNVYMSIETKCGGGDFFNNMVNDLITSKLKVNLLKKEIEKDGKVINIYTID